MAINGATSTSFHKGKAVHAPSPSQQEHKQIHQIEASKAVRREATKKKASDIT